MWHSQSTLHCEVNDRERTFLPVQLQMNMRNRSLLARDNAVFTHHTAQIAALERILKVTLSNLDAFRPGQPVNRPA